MFKTPTNKHVIDFSSDYLLTSALSVSSSDSAGSGKLVNVCVWTPSLTEDFSRESWGISAKEDNKTSGPTVIKLEKISRILPCNFL